MSDLISRQAAIDALRVAYWDDNIQSAKDDPCIVDAMTDWAIRQVKALPPAQPESRPLVVGREGRRMTRLKDLYEYLDYLDSCSDGQFLKFVDAMEKRGYKFVTQYVHDYDYPHVTHCKDCKHWQCDDSESYCDELGIFDTDMNSYCSYAKRKEE